MIPAWALALLACAPEKPAGDRSPPADTDAPVCTPGEPADTDADTELPPGSTGEEPVPCGPLDWVVQLASFSVDGVAGVELSPDGTVVVAGWYARELTLGYKGASPTVLPELCESSSDEMFLAKYALDGTLAWVKQVGGCDHVRAKTFTVRPDGGIVVAGTLSGAVTFAPGEPGETVVATDGWQDVWLFLARYGADGSFEGTSFVDADTAAVEVNDMALGVDGGIYITGSFEKELLFAAGTAQELALQGAPAWDGQYSYSRDLFVAAYAQDGSFRWARVAGSSVGVDTGYGVLVLGDEVLVSANLGNPTTLGAGTPQEVTLTPNGAVDAPLLAYGAADGAFHWARVMAGGPAMDLVETGPDRLAMGGSTATAPAVFGEGEPGQTTLYGSSAWYVAEYEADGALSWAHGGASGPVGSASMSLGMTASNGQIVVAGYFIEGLTLADGTAWVARGSHDAFVALYDDSQQTECAWVLGGAEWDDATGAVADPEGGVIAAGTFRGKLFIEDGKPEATSIFSDRSSTDVFLVRYR